MIDQGTTFRARYAIPPRLPRAVTASTHSARRYDPFWRVTRRSFIFVVGNDLNLLPAAGRELNMRHLEGGTT
jgi:hypothetical protein